MNHKIYKDYIKRLLDILFSFLALILLSPVLLITALLVRIKLGSPVVFKQPRPGMNEKIFSLYKFRSMTNEKGPDGKLLPDSKRLTKFGKFLRASSLDELLEIFNIIKGDMSIVGPRPLSIYYLPHYPENLRKRHAVRPGLTGLAQVNGRNNLPWDDRFEYDIKYVDSVSFFTDVSIIFKTAFKVLKRADVSVRGTTKVKDYGPYRILKTENKVGEKTADMSYSEIGSYFWLEEKNSENPEADLSWLPAVSDSAFTFSGRNAIDIAFRDIIKQRKINKVFMPSYSCVSMLQAFVDRGMKVDFYKVGFENGRFTYELPAADANSLVVVMSYFGLERKTAHDFIGKLKASGAVVIEDITHSLLSDGPANVDSDYLVASLRKWFAVPAGGWVGKTSGTLAEKPVLDSNHAVEEKIRGMKEKSDFISGKISSKEEFLLTLAKFDNDLIHVDRLLKIDDTSLGIIKQTDITKLSEKRRENADVLINGLREEMKGICEFPEIDQGGDVLLFLPVFMKNEDRNSLRKYLIEKNIYCPVHWPEVMGAEKGVRENELSLICDQRYDKADMQRIVECILEWKNNRTRESV